MHYLCEDGIEKSVSWDNLGSSLRKTRRCVFHICMTLMAMY